MLLKIESTAIKLNCLIESTPKCFPLNDTGFEKSNCRRKKVKNLKMLKMRFKFSKFYRQNVILMWKNHFKDRKQWSHQSSHITYNVGPTCIAFTESQNLKSQMNIFQMYQFQYFMYFKTYFYHSFASKIFFIEKYHWWMKWSNRIYYYTTKLSSHNIRIKNFLFSKNFTNKKIN